MQNSSCSSEIIACVRSTDMTVIGYDAAFYAVGVDLNIMMQIKTLRLFNLSSCNSEDMVNVL